MRRLILVSSLAAALILITALLPSPMWETLVGLPAHPLVVHAVVVLLPLIAVATLVGLFVPAFFHVTRLYLVGALGVVSASVIAAKASGEALALAVGLPEEHAEWGERLVPASIVFFVVLVGYAAVSISSPRLAVTRIAAVVVAIVAIAVITLTFFVGHSGAESVWKDRYASALPPQTPASTPSTSITPTPSPTLSPETPAPAPAGPILTLEEVATHNMPSDCWVAIDGAVYDLTGFVSRHPGGSSRIENICGTDASATFAGQHGGEGRPATELEALKLGPLQ